MYTPTLTLPEATMPGVTITLRADGVAVVTARSESDALTTAYHISRFTVAHGTAEDVKTGWGTKTAAGETVLYVSPVA